MDILKGFYKEMDWFIWGMLGIALLWFFSGGTQNQSAHEGAYIKPLAPLREEGDKAYGKYYAGSDGYGKQQLDLPESPYTFFRNTGATVEGFFISRTVLPKQSTSSAPASLFSKSLSFDGVAGAKASNVNDEYVRIVASEDTRPVSISGFTITGSDADWSVALPKAADLLILGAAPVRTNVVVPAGGRVIIESGRSPIGTSFRANMCTGYLDQFQTYAPALRKDCPEPVAELEKAGLAGDSACKNFVEKLPRCRIYQGTVPAELSASCKAFVTNKLNYAACASSHAKDKDYLKDEWRLFLDQTGELWGNKSDIIRLIDDKGKTVDSLSY